ncbi:MAG: 3-deoxy-D-manno-octulosonate 8-phosphate phosphatase (KDO 8-P phosphatase) [Planctomycetota bacterium]|jgi:3-deoxy-D-manno-octulosonate 8-phosphate phosphatase (KDO 8-P phosphatase)
MTTNNKITEIKALLFDVDGILTDNGLYVDEDGRTSKKFCIGDGAGIKLAHMAGLTTGVISGHSSQSTVFRAKQLGMTVCEVGVKDKIPVFERVLADLGLNAGQVLFMGDDYMDLPLLRRAGFAATVPEASSLVRDHCDYVTIKAGGQGAVREIIEYILATQGKLDELMKRFL